MRRRRYLSRLGSEDVDPMGALSNLFDVAMVFAVALMVAVVIRAKMTEFLTQEDVTYVKNAGRDDMEIIVKKDNIIKRYKADSTEGSGKGRRIGSAWQLESGEIVYMPEGDALSEK